MKRFLAFALLLLVLGACEAGSNQAITSDQELAEDQLTRFAQTQPVPVFEWSQLRQNLIEIITAQARTTVTTSFFFNLGVADPVAQCPSIGFPIPASFELTNPTQLVRVDLPGEGNYIDGAVGQMEPTGIYSGETTGTFVICVTASGQAYADYWEGYVKTVTGVAEWRDGQVVLLGEPTFDFSEGQNGG